MIITEMAVDAPLEMSLSCVFDSLTGYGELAINIHATDVIDYDELHLRIAIIESGLFYDAPNGTDWHNQVFRDMLPDVNGMIFSIQQGETLEFNQRFACRNPLIPDNCDVIAFVQSDMDKRVLQAVKIPVVSAPSEVPTLTEWGLIFLSLSILAVGTMTIISGRRKIVAPV